MASYKFTTMLISNRKQHSDHQTILINRHTRNIFIQQSININKDIQQCTQGLSMYQNYVNMCEIRRILKSSQSKISGDGLLKMYLSQIYDALEPYIKLDEKSRRANFHGFNTVKSSERKRILYIDECEIPCVQVVYIDVIKKLKTISKMLRHLYRYAYIRPSEHKDYDYKVNSEYLSKVGSILVRIPDVFFAIVDRIIQQPFSINGFDRVLFKGLGHVNLDGVTKYNKDHAMPDKYFKVFSTTPGEEITEQMANNEVYFQLLEVEAGIDLGIRAAVKRVPLGALPCLHTLITGNPDTVFHATRLRGTIRLELALIGITMMLEEIHDEKNYDNT